MLIINADDLGRNRAATDSILACHTRGCVTSTSAMVFMEDSPRAATLARDAGIDIGLHLNFSERFTGEPVPPSLRADQDRLRRFLKASKYALLVPNPFLVGAFRRVCKAQHEEFVRLYDREPSHVDGHQHLHLATNVLLQRLLPAGVRVRRSFSFRSGEKSFFNRAYRVWVDRQLSRRHRLTDYFYDLPPAPVGPRLASLLALARTHVVEMMTHPERPADYEFLMSSSFADAIADATLGDYTRV
jgi:predicted glycoside hydrolase/deacetylase ChbG (UPF0249 family)